MTILHNIDTRRDVKRMDAAIKEYDNLKAIDTIEASNELSENIRQKIISDMVTANDIKLTLLTFPESNG